MSYRIGELCAGYGGLGMAVRQVLGGDIAWVADNDPGAAAILAYRFPGVPNLGDITEVDWAAVEPVDMLCGGFPCQDVSAAGARAGLRKGNRSGLWHVMAHAIGVLRPSLVIIENVRGLLTARGDEPTAEHLAAEAGRDAILRLRLPGWLETEYRIAVAKGDMDRARRCQARTARIMGIRQRAVARCQWHERRLVRAIGTVLGSLADLGYDAQWAVVSAAEAGAPHRRERVFIAARPAAGTECEPVRRRRVAGVLGGAESAPAGVVVERETPEWQRKRDGGTTADRGQATAQDPDRATGGERRLPGPGQAPGRGARADTGGPGGARAPADTEGDGRSEGRPEPAGVVGGPDAAECGHGTPADTEGDRAGRDAPVTLIGGGQARQRPGAGDRVSPADTDRGGLPELEERHGGPLAGIGGASRDDPERCGETLAVSWGAYEPAVRRWETITGRPAPRPTEPGRTGDRLSPAFVEFMMGLPGGWVTDVPGLSRNAQLKALGNGVVPAQAAMALRMLLAAAFPAAVPAEAVTDGAA